jgi:hypothetical protein
LAPGEGSCGERATGRTHSGYAASLPPPITRAARYLVMSGQGEEQPLEPGLVGRRLLAGSLGCHALLQPAGDELEAGAVQRPGDGGELRDDVGQEVGREA